MPDFAYIARDRGGQKVAGTISAASVRDAVAALDARALFPVRVEAGEQQQTLVRRRGGRVRPQLIATFYTQLASLLRSGVPLLRSLALLQEQTSHAGLKQILEEVYAQVEDGATLAEAMGRFPKAFHEMAVSMVRAGGEGGFLEEALERISQFTENQQDLKSRTVGALAYPILLAAFGTVVVTVLVVFFVPQFEVLFGRLREQGQLPVLTEGLLWVSNTATSWWGLGFLVLLLVVGFYLHTVLRTDEGRLWRDRWKLKLPVVGPIFKNMAVARFCRVLGTMLRNGVPILRALEISSDATGNKVLAAAILDAAENVTAGESLARPLATSGHFPGTVVEMISVAEEANNLEKVLTDIADSLERQTWRRLDLFVRMLEPVMLLILASIVLVVAIALLLPMLKMSDAL